MLYQVSYFRNLVCGRRWIRTTEGIIQQIYSLPHLATLVFAPKYLKDSFRSSLRLFSQGRVSSHSSQASFRSLNVLFRASCRIRTNDPEITNHVLWPTELKRRSLSRLVATGVVPKSDAKLWLFSLPTKPFANFFVRKFHLFSLTFSLPDN